MKNKKRLQTQAGLGIKVGTKSVVGIFRGLLDLGKFLVILLRILSLLSLSALELGDKGLTWLSDQIKKDTRKKEPVEADNERDCSVAS